MRINKILLANQRGAFIVSVFVFSCLLLWPPKINAQTVLAIEPTRLELALKPGETANNNLRVSNRGDKPITVELSTEAFSVTNERYDFTFSEAEELSKWLRLKEPFIDIAPGKTEIIDYQLAVPNNAEPGGRYLAIFAKVISNTDQSNIYPRAGQLLYLTVAGNFKKDGLLVDIAVPRLVFNRNVDWSYRVQNTGTVHFYSPVEVLVFDIFGRQVQSAKNENLIMPNSVRLINTTTQIPIWPGFYFLKTTFSVADRSVPAVARPILFLPVPFIMALPVIFYWLYRLIQRLKKAKGSAQRQ